MKILTWNTQGERLDGIIDRLKSLEPDAACIQEAGDLPTAMKFPGTVEIHEPVYLGTAAGYNVWYLLWDAKGGNGNCRCSMAMMFKVGGGPAVSLSQHEKKRSLMRKTIGKYYVANIHAGGADYIKEAIASVKTNAGVHHPWVVVGDFNQCAKYKSKLSECLGDNKLIFCSDGPSRPQSNSYLDYAIGNVDGKASLKTWNGFSDHVPVLIELP